MVRMRCPACGRYFRPRPQVRSQTYCSAPDCQRERRRRRQKEKRRTDPDYRDNDLRCRRDWATSNPDYWKRYRDEHPGYTDRNRRQQQARNRKQREARIAKEDLARAVSGLPSGRYRIVRIEADGIANEDVSIVEITVLSTPCEDS